MEDYTKALRAKMVQRLLMPDAPTERELSKRTGIPRSTLQLWKRQAMGQGDWGHGKRAASETPRRTEDWSPQDRMRVVVEAAGLGPAELGEFLRREGLHAATLLQWQQDALEGLSGTEGRDPRARRIAELEKELARKEKALAESAALLLLQKKVRAILGAEDDYILETTAPESSPSSTKR